MPVARFESSPLLSAAGFVHAFFTRHSGYSTGPFSSLNFSVIVGDSEESVRANLALASEQLGVRPERICCARQVHGRAVVALEPDAQAVQVQQQQADAVISLHPQQAAGVRTADCLPILLADATSGAVAAVHAGWRGVTANVVGAAVARLKSVVASPGRLLASIGPHISSAGFEVADVTAGGPAEVAGVRVGDQIVAVDGRPAVDLELPAVRARLRREPAGTVVRVTLERGDAKRDVELTLRDLL